MYRPHTQTDYLIQGYGTLLMEEAERIARNEHKSTKEHKFELIFSVSNYMIF